MFGLPPNTLQQITDCCCRFSDIQWVKIYGSRAMGNYQKGSDIDLAYSSTTNHTAALLAALDALPTPYLFDITHYESLQNMNLKSHIDRVGILIINKQH